MHKRISDLDGKLDNEVEGELPCEIESELYHEMDIKLCCKLDSELDALSIYLFVCVLVLIRPNRLYNLQTNIHIK